ncbi:fluoride efflux transporter CrcB [Methylibium sp.]|uniref:fluoride efflux transporter CrcB n=1 Tax=Methylibium sp. TaxID=2067992 RepID=UPI00184F5648|nr:fluoride efflux transporter CrcB [Methylibium sp.]MBA3591186.1 fluoride efflux transporter CrcB [Methylibium sp.]
MSATLPQALCVMAGAAAGALLRWFAGLWLNTLWAAFPLGTLAVNAIGGLGIGVALAWFTQRPEQELLRLLLVTGVLGGFTTFSAFSAESLNLLQRGAAWTALGHTLAHVVGSLVCAALGWMLGQALLRSR